MSNLKDALKNTFPPEPGEVWLVKGEGLNLDPENIKKRPVLILYNKKAIGRDTQIINAIPLSASRKTDLMCFRINKNSYNYIVENFNAKDSSTALIQFYQPINRNFFVKRLGKLELNIYSAIKDTLKNQLIGGDIDFDLSLN